MVEMKTLRANGITMEYLRAGPEDGQPVLLIHGLGWDGRRLWDGVAQALAEAGYLVLAPNLRGVGETDATDVPYTTQLYAEDLEAFLSGLRVNRAPVVGFSMGASIVGALLSVSTRVSAISLACGGLHGTEEGRIGVEEMLARAESLGPATFASEQADAIFRPEWAAENPDAVADFKVWRAEMNQSALFRAFRSGYGIDVREAVQTAGLPTQVIAADEDAFCDLGDMREMAASIPGARFDIIEACGHMATIEQPKAFNTALLSFLHSLRSGA